MVLGTTVDLSILSYPVLVIMKEQGADVGQGGVCPQTSARGGASPRTSGEVEPTLEHWARQSLPPDVGRGKANPRMSGEA